MSVEHHPLIKDFPEHRDAIHRLKESDNHFKKLMEKYDSLDKEIFNGDTDVTPMDDEHLEELKKKRLLLKDELAGMLAKA